MGKTIEKPQYLGLELDIDQTGFNRQKVEYIRFCEAVKTVADEIRRVGLTPLDAQSISSLRAGNFDRFLDEFTEIAEKQELGFIFKPIKQKSIKESRHSLLSFLNESKQKLFSFQVDDCPIIDGYAVFTPEFEEQVRERFVQRINTENGAEFYELFLQVRETVQKMVALGYSPFQYYEFTHDDIVLYKFSL